jgi:hypothetical protein
MLVEPDIVDSTISFGTMQIGPGRALQVGDGAAADPAQGNEGGGEIPFNPERHRDALAANYLIQSRTQIGGHPPAIELR